MDFSYDTYILNVEESTSFLECPKVPLPETGDVQPFIFISYSHRDYKAVFKDLAFLYVNKVRFWYDSGLSAGKNWMDEAWERITSPNCIGIIFFISENAFLSSSIPKELQFRKDNNKKFFSVNLENGKLPSAIITAIYKKYSDTELSAKGFNMKRVMLLGDSFPDEVTFLAYHSPTHNTELLSGVQKAFSSAVVFSNNTEEVKKESQGDTAEIHFRAKTSTKTYPDGTRYEGEWLMGLRHGEGVLYGSDGVIRYSGCWDKDMPNGSGRMNVLEEEGNVAYVGHFINGKLSDENGLIIYPEEYEYRGAVKNGRWMGEGSVHHPSFQMFHGRFSGYKGSDVTIEYDNGDVYHGETYRFLPQGQGRMDHKNGEWHEGQFLDGKLEGQGEYHKSEKEYYKGQFRNGKPYGAGEFHFSEHKYFKGQFEEKSGLKWGEYYLDGTLRYKGPFQGMKYHGKNGEYYYNDGDKYVGEWKEGLRDGIGTQYYADGKTQYEGPWVAGIREGQNGTYYFESGNYYVGSWKNGLRDGIGTLYYQDGRKRYEGPWVAGKYEGQNGTYYYESGNYYVGGWKNDLRDGIGTLYYEDGRKQYEGPWVAGKREGQNGTDYYENGNYYVGGWKNGLRDGIGTLYYEDGRKQYEGPWVAGKWEGQKGIYYWEDGRYYIGGWKNNLREGMGTLYYADGKKHYEGPWVAGKYEGQNGSYYWEDGRYYVGDWKNNLQDGIGTEFYADGRKRYEGPWAAGRKEGQKGTYYWGDGRYYVGEWKNNLQDGAGIEYFPNQIVFTGTWRLGQKHGPGTLTRSDGSRKEEMWVDGLRISKDDLLEMIQNGSADSLERHLQACDKTDILNLSDLESLHEAIQLKINAMYSTSYSQYTEDAKSHLEIIDRMKKCRVHLQNLIQKSR